MISFATLFLYFVFANGGPHPELHACRHNIFDESKLHRIVFSRNWRKAERSLLRSGTQELDVLRGKRYYFALNVHNNEESLPYTIAAIVKACALLGRGGVQPCFLSIYESGSSDSTRAILSVLEKRLLRFQLPNRIMMGGLTRAKGQQRIEFLASVRNKVMVPFYENASLWDEVVFLNDVVLCAGGILEMLMHKHIQRADVASGMDYSYTPSKSQDAVAFYDIWVNRDMSGRRFMNYAPYILEKSAWESFSAGRPFQVFVTWAGGVVMSARLFQERHIRFRHSGLLECAGCECELLMKDLWYHSGHSGLKVMVVPTVFSAYSLNAFNHIAEYLESKFQLVTNGGFWNQSRIDFSRTPPDSVECASMAFADEQLVDLETLLVNTSWAWWYSFNKISDNATSESAINYASSFIKATNPETCEPTTAQVPAKLHFVVHEMNPLRLPHNAFMNILEWIRLHPCFEVHVHTRETLKIMLAHIGWATEAIHEISDAKLHYIANYVSYRLHGFLAVYLHGGIFADWEAAPLRELDLHKVGRIDAAFLNVSYGGGPYIIAAIKSSQELRNIILHALAQKDDPPDVGTHNDASFSAEYQFQYASHVIGKTNFEKHVGVVPGHLRDVTLFHQADTKPQNLHRSTNVLYDHEVLMDGEVLLFSLNWQETGTYLWSIQGLNVHQNLPEVSRMMHLSLRSSKKTIDSDEGCLIMFSSGNSSTNTSFGSAKVVWKQCWPKSLEQDQVYLEYDAGKASVYTSQHGLCSLTSNKRKTLWTSPPPSKDLKAVTRQYELRVGSHGELASIYAPYASTENVESTAHAGWPRCYAFAEGCDGLKVWQRSVMRYNQACESLTMKSTTFK